MTVVYVFMGLWVAYNVYADFRDESKANCMTSAKEKA